MIGSESIWPDMLLISAGDQKEGVVEQMQLQLPHCPVLLSNDQKKALIQNIICSYKTYKFKNINVTI
jgi:hypothetical protein